MRRKECIAVLKESPMPTRWMRAYISIYLIALIVQLAIYILGITALMLLEKSGPVSIQAILLLGGGLLLLACTAIAYPRMIGLRPSGFFWCVAHLILCALYWTTEFVLNLVPDYDSAGLGYVPYAVLILVIYVGGWVIPNYLYFQKRRQLFRKYAPSEIAFAKMQWHSL